MIPLFIEAIKNNSELLVHGDGFQSRDFTFVTNAILANELSLFVNEDRALKQIYNIGCGNKTSLLEIIEHIEFSANKKAKVRHLAERTGDVRHSLADISKAREFLRYRPLHSAAEGLEMLYNQLH